MSWKKKTKAERMVLKLYHLESLRKVMLYDELLTERQLVIKANHHLPPARVVRFTHKILDEAIYEMLEDHEIEGNSIDGWKLIGMEVTKAKIDYRGIPSAHVVENGTCNGAAAQLRKVIDWGAGEACPVEKKMYI